MDIKQVVLHKIDRRINQPIKKDISLDNADFKEYIIELIKTISEGKGKRRFEYTRDTVEMMVIMKRMLDNAEFDKMAEISAARLLEKEVQAQDEIGSLAEIPVGMLFQTFISLQHANVIIIAKADNSEYLDDASLTRQNGIPIKKKIYKAFLAEFNNEKEITRLAIYDTNFKISKYWWYDYLELSEVYTDNYNTDNAFEGIKKELGRIKKKSEVDYNILYNRTLGYFRSNETFDIDNYISNALEGYEPESNKIKIADIIQRVRNLPEDKDFDASFEIDRTVMRGKRLKNIVPLDDGKMELHINEFLENMSDIIKPVIIQQDKYLQIKTVKGYNAFNYMQVNNHENNGSE